MRITPTTSRLFIVVFSLALVAFAASCGTDEVAEPTATNTPTSDDDHTDDMDDETGDMHSEDDGGHHDSFAFGEPADAADADRTIEIEAKDIEFVPASIQISMGEIITFVVTNTGAIAHDFTLGDVHVQQEHAAEMSAMDDTTMAHDDVNVFVIDPGETKELTWHFTQAGEVLYGCHQTGHYDAGMVGTITVS